MQPHLQERPGVEGLRLIRPIFPAEQAEPPINRDPRRRRKLAQGTPDATTEGKDYQQLWLSLLPAILEAAGTNAILWVSSPLADYLVAAARPHVRLAIYDCMDDLASFRDGTDEMHRREAHLLRLVDLLFTGGYSMYEARKTRHPRAYCFPSGVDIAHYRRVREPATRVPVAIARIPRPRLGYFGVLDERIDWELIATVAAQRPDWHWLLIGPRVKVKRAELPVASNIHYLGKQPYARLPAYLKGFDIATMPFALNEATRSISPTKTLEYLAGGKPVISTSVPDVVAGYREIVHIADGPAAWLEAVDRVLGATEDQRQARLARASTILEESSWDSIVERMWALIGAQL